MAIFKGKAYSLEFADGFPPGSSVTIIDSGGIIETHFHDLVTSLQPHKAVRPYPLLLDGHSSQKGLQAVEFFEQRRNIHMVCLPHTLSAFRQVLLQASKVK
jgi:hypothetical protein